MIAIKLHPRDKLWARNCTNNMKDDRDRMETEGRRKRKEEEKESLEPNHQDLK